MVEGVGFLGAAHRHDGIRACHCGVRSNRELYRAPLLSLMGQLIKQGAIPTLLKAGFTGLCPHASSASA